MNSVVLEVVVGMALLYYLTATLVSGLAEGITRLMNTRSQMLWAALARLLEAPAQGQTRSLGSTAMFKSLARKDDPRPQFGGTVSATAVPPADRLTELAAAPSIQSIDYVTTKGVLTQSSQTKVANIPGRVFAAALLEIANTKANGATLQAQLTALASAYAGSPLGAYLTTLAANAGNDLDKVTDQISQWFDQQMVRVSQTYRKNIKYVLAVLGLLVAVVCNVDSVQVAGALNSNADLRQVITATAGKVTPTDRCSITEQQQPDPTKRTIQCGLDDLRAFGGTGVVVPLSDNWGKRWTDSWSSTNAALHVLGLLLTTGAVALGGPMWFDFLMLLTGRKKSG